ncbi:hypothetical protein HDU92_000518 [Lobulomyces angularis]|nr:hypothetical protein HDU92_000518 [Lobulomyces angularis]
MTSNNDFFNCSSSSSKRALQKHVSSNDQSLSFTKLNIDANPIEPKFSQLINVDPPKQFSSLPNTDHLIFKSSPTQSSFPQNITTQSCPQVPILKKKASISRPTSLMKDFSNTFNTPTSSYFSQTYYDNFQDSIDNSEFSPGDEIGPYVLQKKIGTGAFGTVYKARKESLPNSPNSTSPTVAVKVINRNSRCNSISSSLSHSLQSNFIPENNNNNINPDNDIDELVSQETDIWKQLSHPNILSLHDVVQAEGNIFVISEIAKGGSLLQYIQNNPGGISEKDAARLFRELIYAVKYMHDLGIVHRDIKAENILLVDKFDEIEHSFTKNVQLNSTTAHHHHHKKQSDFHLNTLDQLFISPTSSTPPLTPQSIRSANSNSIPIWMPEGKVLFKGNNENNISSLTNDTSNNNIEVNSSKEIFSSTASLPFQFEQCNEFFHNNDHTKDSDTDYTPTQSNADLTQCTKDINSYVCKLADFGLSGYIHEKEKDRTVVGSIHYCSPEEIKQQSFGQPSSDIWSLGVVLFAMVTGTLPFNDDYIPRLQQQIINGRYDKSKLEKFSKNLQDLISSLLQVQKEKRITMAQLLQHPWVLENL